MENRSDIAFISVTGEAAALAGALIGLLIERRVLHPADLDLLLDRARELSGSDEPTGGTSANPNVVRLRDWPLKR